MQNRQTKIAAIDIFFVAILLVSALGVVARYVLIEENGILSKTPENTEAAVSVLITDIEGTSSKLFVEGEELSIVADGNGNGHKSSVIADFTVTPAEYYAENEEGELFLAYHDEDNGNIDCRGALRVNGFYRNGFYYLDGETLLNAGMTVTLTDGKVKVTALVTELSLMSKQ